MCKVGTSTAVLEAYTPSDAAFEEPERADSEDYGALADALLRLSASTEFCTPGHRMRRGYRVFGATLEMLRSARR